MVDSSNDILCDLFLLSYSSLYIPVCFHCKSVLFSFFSLGPEVKAIKLRFDFSYVLVH